jgi:16S rRNA (guanine527-N7)-methyltransferase
MAAPEMFHKRCAGDGIHLLPADLAKQEKYLRLLLAENKVMNLTAAATEEEVWLRHIADSLLLVPLVKRDGTAIDVGSGGGLPGIPIAIQCPDLRLTLLESTRKKCGFLERTVEALELDRVTVRCGRSEVAARDTSLRASFDYAIARALAPLPVLLELTVPFLREGGRLLAMKGARADEELETAKEAFTKLRCGLEDIFFTGESGSRVLVIRKEAPTPDPYPRRTGIPAKRPL